MTSVIVTIVLLNVDWMCAMPLGTFFLTFLLRLAPLRPRGAPSSIASAMAYARRLAGSACAAPLAGLMHLALARALAGARVGVRALAAHRQALAVAQAAVAAEVHQALDVHRDLAAQIAFDLVARRSMTSRMRRISFVVELVGPLVERHVGLVADLARDARVPMP